MRFTYIGLALLCTVFGQLITKWQANVHGPANGFDFDLDLLRMFWRPWFLAAYVSAFAASIFWVMAVSRMDVSKAYPFMSLALPMVVVLSHLLLGEALTPPRLIGIALVCTGLILVGNS